MFKAIVSKAMPGSLTYVVLSLMNVFAVHTEVGLFELDMKVKKCKMDYVLEENCKCSPFVQQGRIIFSMCCHFCYEFMTLPD